MGDCQTYSGEEWKKVRRKKDELRIMKEGVWAAICNLPFDLFSLGRRSVSLVDGVLFGHVFALLCRAVKTRAFPVVNMRLRVNPHKTVAPALCGCVRRCCLGRGARRGRWASGRCTR